MRAAVYARVSTQDQTPDNQLLPLRAFIAARGWTVAEYVDHGISGSKESRPALDALLKAARSRKVDAIVVTKLDRLARSVHHLLSVSKELQALGVATSSRTGTSTPRRPRSLPVCHARRCR
jgi:DNA invertase Pin-like site-specific DNA recombinase